jgi:hypothetical protein
MTMRKVESSAIEALGYDAESQTLHAQFRSSGEMYLYPNVSEREYQALLAAPSIGGHFAKHIRNKGEKAA